MALTPLDTFASLEDALAEIQRLRARVAELESALARSRGPDHSTRLAADDGESAEGRLGALERFAGQITTVRTERRSESARESERSDGDDAANRHLAELRAAIGRLREERAQASVELLHLTRLNPARVAAAAAPSPGVRPAAGPAPASVSSAPALAPAQKAVPPREQPAAAPDTPPTAPASTVDTASAATAASASVPPPPEPEFALAAVAAPAAETAAVKGSARPAPGPPALVQARDIASLTVPVDRSPRRLAAVMAVVAAVAVGVAVAWLATRGSERLSPPQASRPAPETPPRSDSPTVPASVAEPAPGDGAPLASATPPAAETPAPPASATRAEGGAATLQISALRDVWLRVIVDGDQKKASLLAAGQTLTYGLQTGATVRTGDAGAVSVTVNGVSLGTMGRDGAVVTRTFEAPAPDGPR